MPRAKNNVGVGANVAVGMTGTLDALAFYMEGGRIHRDIKIINKYKGTRESIIARQETVSDDDTLRERELH